MRYEKMPFVDRLRMAERMPESPIPVVGDRVYLNKVNGKNVVKISFFGRSYHYGSTHDDEEAAEMSLRMCEVVNDEVTRRADDEGRDIDWHDARIAKLTRRIADLERQLKSKEAQQ